MKELFYLDADQFHASTSKDFKTNPFQAWINFTLILKHKIKLEWPVPKFISPHWISSLTSSKKDFSQIKPIFTPYPVSPLLILLWDSAKKLDRSFKEYQ